MSIAVASRPAHIHSRSAASPDSHPPPVPLRLRRVRPRDDLRASVADGAAVSAMVGIGETYFAAFALALGTGETVAGLIATLPMLAGATLQLATPWFLQRAKSYKRWVVLFASLQATALLAMPLATWLTGHAAACWVAIAAACYWAASQATGPAWNTWIEEIVPRRLRANFFALRARICQAATLAGFVAGALALECGKASGWLLPAFAGIFLLGAACRYTSAWCLSRQSEPSRGRYHFRRVPVRQALVQTGQRRGATLVLYLLLMQAAVQVSGPYFGPYMLGHLKLSYVSFMVLIGLGFVGKLIALPLWGRIAHQAGAPRLLWIGGIGIVPVASLWLLADWLPTSGDGAPDLLEMTYLCGVQLISGFVWAAYELAMLLMFLEAIPRQDRPCIMTYYNFGNAAAQVVGGFLGAAILHLGGESHAAYMFLFAGSSIMRLATVPLLRITTQPAQPLAQPALAKAA